MKTDLILLVLNEFDGLTALLPQIDRTPFNRVFAVDGGSTDGSLELLAEAGVDVVGQSRRGRGEAFRIGVDASDADAFVFFSPDGNEDHGDLARMVRELEGGADLVIASRMMPESHNEEDDDLIKPRRWANNAFNMALNFTFNPHPFARFITDSINGYRGFRRSAIPVIEPFPADYTVEYRMTARALQAGLRVVEFPTYEGERIGGETKVPSLQAGLRFIRAYGSELVRSTRGRIGL